MKLSRRSAAMAGAALVAVAAMTAATVAVTSKRQDIAEAPAPAAALQGVYGIGTVEARIQSEIGFELGGTLVELAADQGDRVGKGAVLARLDPREQQAVVAQAEAGLVQAEAAMLQARARLDRARAVQTQKRSVNQRRQELQRKGTVSAEAAEDAQAAAEIAVADVAVAQADVEAARGNLESARASLNRERERLAKFTLTAPYDGMVVKRERELGAAVVAGSQVFTVIDPATVWVRAYVDEAQAGALTMGQPARIALRSMPGKEFAGKVARIDIEADRVSEERKVHVGFDAVPADFHLGEQAEVFVDAGR